MSQTSDISRERRNTRLASILLIVSVPLWAALGSVSALIVWIGGIPGMGFATGILVTAVIFYFIMVLAIVKQSATSPTESVQLEMTSVRQEIRALGDKLEGVRRTLEE
jgi:hypothetical protein